MKRSFLDAFFELGAGGEPHPQAAADRGGDPQCEQPAGAPLPSPPLDDGVPADLPRGGALVFDTETSSIRGHVLQFAMVIIDGTGTEVFCYDRLWRLPPSISIDPRAEAVHGISAQRLAREGADPCAELRRVARIFAAARAHDCQLVAHNARFDCERLAFTAAHHGLPAPVRLGETLCTMRASAPLCDVRNKGGKRKAPRCSELHVALFGREFEGPLHDALQDSRMTARCFAEGRRRGWWR